MHLGAKKWSLVNTAPLPSFRVYDRSSLMVPCVKIKVFDLQLMSRKFNNTRVKIFDLSIILINLYLTIYF